MALRIARAVTEEQWIEWAVHGFLAAATGAVSARGSFHVVMAGGSTPKAVLERLGTLRCPVWNRTHVYFSDERGVGPDHPESNYRMVRETWLDPAAVPPSQVARIEGERDLEDAARAYNERVTPVLEGEGRFDLVVLGLGPDGHTASLIPGVSLDYVADPWVGVGPAPMSPAQVRRVTLTAAALRRSRATTFWVRGEGKAEVVHAAVTGEGTATIVPEVVDGVPEVTWLLDAGAAARLSPGMLWQPER